MSTLQDRVEQLESQAGVRAAEIEQLVLQVCVCIVCIRLCVCVCVCVCVSVCI